MLTDFQNSFTDRLTGKFAKKTYLNIPPRLKYVATLCHCLVKYESENWRQSEISIVINEPSISVMMGLLHCKFITQFPRERILKIGEHSAKLQAKWLIAS